MGRSDRHRRHRRVREASAPRYASPPPGEGVGGILLDSDVVIEILRRRVGTADALRAVEAQGIPTYCCAVAWAEVAAGLRPGEEPVTDAFFDARGDVVIDGETGKRAGAYLARYAKSHGVGIADALVAAAARTAGLHLWTLNRTHYPMDDVRLCDPASGRPV